MENIVCKPNKVRSSQLLTNCVSIISGPEKNIQPLCHTAAISIFVKLPFEIMVDSIFIRHVTGIVSSVQYNFSYAF